MQTIGTPSWVDLGAGSTPVAVSAGAFHTCAIVDNGSLFCWGSNGNGRLGTGDPPTQDAYSPKWVDLGVGRTAVAISAGNTHTCAILDDGSLTCFGNDYSGQLGNGPGQSDSSVPGIVDGGFTWDNSTGSNSGSSATNLIASSEGAELMVGDLMNDITFQYDSSAASGSGSGSGSGSSTSFNLTSQNIAGGRLYTCAILENGSVACWGDNQYGQLGDGTTTDRSTPTLTESLGTGRTAVQLATGDYHTCALLDNHEVKCWGHNQYGKLGDGATNDRTSPPSSGITFPTGRTPIALAAGDEQTCAIMDDGSLTCWGGNAQGELGDGTTTHRSSPTIISVSTTADVIDIGSGDAHTCALLDDGTIKCWGNNIFGQLGDGTTTTRLTPTLTDSLGTGRTAVDIGVGEHFTCALLDNDDVKCWGSNLHGRLGDGTTIDRSSPPSSGITFPSGVTPVALSDSGANIEHACALLDLSLIHI